MPDYKQVVSIHRGGQKQNYEELGNYDTRIPEGWLGSCCTQYVRSCGAHTRPHRVAVSARTVGHK